MGNYAPNPKKQTVYEGLAQKRLNDITSTDIVRFTDPTYVMANNQDSLLTFNLINQAMNRNNAAPIPDKGKVVQTTGDSDRTQFRPEVGEVWKLNGGDILETGTATFTVNFKLIDSDGNHALIGTASSTGQEAITVDAFFEGEIFITNSLYLYADVTAGEGRVSTALVQIM